MALLSDVGFKNADDRNKFRTRIMKSRTDILDSYKYIHPMFPPCGFKYKGSTSFDFIKGKHTMQIKKGKCNTSGPKTEDINGVKFGSVIQIPEKPEYWPGYDTFNADTLWLLTSDYKTAGGSSTSLMIVGLARGQVAGVKQNTKVIVRNDVTVCDDS